MHGSASRQIPAWLLINTMKTEDEIACAATSLALANLGNPMCHNGFHLKALLGYAAHEFQTASISLPVVRSSIWFFPVGSTTVATILRLTSMVLTPNPNNAVNYSLALGFSRPHRCEIPCTTRQFAGSAGVHYCVPRFAPLSGPEPYRHANVSNRFVGSPLCSFLRTW